MLGESVAQDPSYLTLIDLAREPDFRVGGVSIRPSTREVVVAGVTAVLEPRIMQVLVALARRRSEVVSRADLIALCWGRRTVGDDALNRCIQALRRLADTHGGFTLTTVARVGHRLDEIASGAAEPVLGSSPSSERRRLTALACRLAVGGGESSSLDPEDWRAVTVRFRQAVEDAVAPYGGLMQGQAGELVVYFGYPRAREDAAECAIRAGLAVLEGMARLKVLLADTIGDADLLIRLGVDAGLALVARDGDSLEFFGEAADAATRVQVAGDPNTLAVSAAVARLARGWAGTGSKGFCDGDFQVIAPAAPGHPAGGSGRFVGREAELDALAEQWRRVQGRQGQLALVSGEPGIGKSRLVQQFKATLADEPHVWVECAGSRMFASTPLHAVAETVRLHLRATLGDGGGEAALQALTDGAKRGRLDPAVAVPLIAELIGLPQSAVDPAPALAPDETRRRLLHVLAAWALGVATQAPVVVVVEDPQWLDPSTLELLHSLAETGAAASLFLVCAARPEFEAPWPTRGHHRVYPLSRLDSEQTGALIRSVDAGAGAGLGAALVEAVIERADGVPLFAEELTRLMLDQGGDGGSDVPASLLDSLTARLDRLGAARQVAQLAAVLGRTFSFDLLAAVSSRPNRELRAALKRLQGADLIQARGTPPNATYQFRHALIREAAYQGLVRARRRELHAEVARTLIGGNAAEGEARPEIIAQHWADAGEAEKAIAAWIEAAREAEAHHAFDEAIRDYREALGVLATLPDTPERDRRELELLAPLSALVAAKRGIFAEDYMAIDVRGAYLAEKSGTLVQLVIQKFVSFMVAWSGADLSKASGLAIRVSELAQREGGSLSLRVAETAGLLASIGDGNLDTADRHHLNWVAIHDRAGVGAFAGETMAVFAVGAQVAYYLGKPNDAQVRIERGLAIARAGDNPHDLAIIMGAKAWLHALMRDPPATETTAIAALELAEQQGLTQANHARASLAWALAHLGRSAEAIALAERSFSGWVGGGVPRLVEAKRVLAQAKALSGDPAGALAMYDEVFALHADNRFLRSEHLICRAEIRERAGDLDAAEADWREALALARATNAKSLELRASTALARHLQARGDCDAARALLTPIHAWFDPTLDNRDMADARALLADLPHPPRIA